MKSRLILENLQKIGRTADSLLNILIGDNTYRRLKRKALYPTLPDFSKVKSRAFMGERNNLRGLLFRLEKQGLIQKKRRDRKNYWFITPSGRKKLGKLKDIPSFPRPFYEKIGDAGLNIMIFDIPEKEKTKRNWLRQALLSLDFELLQKSVWIGKNKLPEAFLTDLHDLKLIGFIHIFKVLKLGTIKRHWESYFTILSHPYYLINIFNICYFWCDRTKYNILGQRVFLWELNKH